ncbi:MAG: hypothetical protein Q8O05_07345, partial [Chloroflexota bacterium]|nr:hypothetical protein [Chloroflexota bacterium]
FAFFTHNRWALGQLERQVQQYGLTEHMVPGDYLDGYSYHTFGDMFKNPEKYTNTITQAIKKVVANGAGVIMAASLPLNVWLIKQGITEIDGACILDQFGFIVKQAELMVELKKIGIKRSKYGPLQKEMLEAMQKLYLP